jgi:hypothetical protein
MNRSLGMMLARAILARERIIKQNDRLSDAGIFFNLCDKEGESKSASVSRAQGISKARLSNRRLWPTKINTYSVDNDLERRTDCTTSQARLCLANAKIRAKNAEQLVDSRFVLNEYLFAILVKSASRIRLFDVKSVLSRDFAKVLDAGIINRFLEAFLGR